MANKSRIFAYGSAERGGLVERRGRRQVAARLVEEVSGQPYEKFVRDEILAPLGIRDMGVGKSLRSGRAKDEVVYYDEKGRKDDAMRKMAPIRTGENSFKLR